MHNFVFFSSSSSPLSLYVELYVALMQLALIPFVERSIEAMHAMIKSIPGTNVLPQYVCAKIREVQNMRLFASGDFYSFCLDTWRQHGFLNNMLHLRLPLEKLKTLTNHAKISACYQCDLDSEYCDMGAAKVQAATWAASRTQILRQLGDVPLPDAHKQLVF